MWQGRVVKWQGIVLRVDSYDDADSDVWIGELQHKKHLVSNVEILVNMFSSKDFDLVL